MTTTTNRADVAKATSERAPVASVPDKNGAAPAAAAAAPAAGGFKTYLPLIANLVLMPVLAYAMTAFVLVPKLAKKSGAHNSSPAKTESHEAAPAHGESAHGAAAESGPGKGKISVPLGKKILVNVSGTMGTRYLLAEFVLVGGNANFKEAVEKADAELRDAAASCLSSKSISDLEKPGIRNLIRTELTTIFNTILGKGAVTEIYLTEFAIQ
jgi:flagellar FliL protein